MQIKEVTHERVRNLGNYESARVSLTAVLHESEDEQEVLQELKRRAERFLFPNKPKA